MSMPAEKFRWTVDRYNRAVETGFLAPDDHFELIDGELIAVVPPNPPHARAVRRLNRIFSSAIAGNEFVVCVQDPIAFGPDSHPEPDVTIVRGPEELYANRHPGPPDVLLAIEVADTSARYDRDVKLPLYARQGIPESWLVDINQRCIEVHREPSDAGYQKLTTCGDDTVTPAHCPEVTVNLADLFWE